MVTSEILHSCIEGDSKLVLGAVWVIGYIERGSNKSAHVQ